MSMLFLVAKCEIYNYAHSKGILLVDILVDIMLCGRYLIKSCCGRYPIQPHWTLCKTNISLILKLFTRGDRSSRQQEGVGVEPECGAQRPDGENKVRNLQDVKQEPWPRSQLEQKFLPWVPHIGQQCEKLLWGPFVLKICG